MALAGTLSLPSRTQAWSCDNVLREALGAWSLLPLLARIPRIKSAAGRTHAPAKRDFAPSVASSILRSL